MSKEKALLVHHFRVIQLHLLEEPISASSHCFPPCVRFCRLPSAGCVRVPVAAQVLQAVLLHWGRALLSWHLWTAFFPSSSASLRQRKRAPCGSICGCGGCLVSVVIPSPQ